MSDNDKIIKDVLKKTILKDLENLNSYVDQDDIMDLLEELDEINGELENENQQN